MKIDEQKVKEIIKGIKEGTASKLELKNALGGEKLEEIFDASTLEALFNNIISIGKIHNFIQNGSGLNMLEGLLNNKITGNMADFYMIKPDYILSLSKKEQLNMAYSISGGREDLAKALQNLWSRGLKTEACTTKAEDNISMIQLSIDENDKENQDIIQQLYEQEGIQGSSLYDYEAKKFQVNLSGENLYNYLQNENISTSKENKNNIFETALKESLEFTQEMYESRVKNGISAEELKQTVELIKERINKFNDNQNEKQVSREDKTEFINELRSNTYNLNQIEKEDKKCTTKVQPEQSLENSQYIK